MKKNLILIIAFFQSLFIPGAFCQKLSQIDFYGIASKDTERNMLSMTEDIFLAQLKELEYNIEDKRKSSFSEDFFSGAADFSASDIPETGYFYAVISKISQNDWEMRLTLKIHGYEEPKTAVSNYNSYYKILMDSKVSLRGIVENLAKNYSGENSPEKKIGRISFESLAGSWNDGKYLNKIVIMRGGRGFVIFKNGAPMNISVKINDEPDGTQSIKISQTSGNNASYFPEIDRQKALENAMQAEPVVWNFKMESPDVLSGTIETLVQTENGRIERKELPSKWTKN